MLVKIQMLQMWMWWEAVFYHADEGSTPGRATKYGPLVPNAMESPTHTHTHHPSPRLSWAVLFWKGKITVLFKPLLFWAL